MQIFELTERGGFYVEQRRPCDDLKKFFCYVALLELKPLFESVGYNVNIIDHLRCF